MNIRLFHFSFPKLSNLLFGDIFLKTKSGKTPSTFYNLYESDYSNDESTESIYASLY